MQNDGKLKLFFYPEKTFNNLWLAPNKSYTVCDVAIGGFSPTEERIKEGASFTQITARFDQSLLVRKNDFATGKIVSYSSFKNTHYKIGVVFGTTGEKYAYERAKENNVSLQVFKQYKSEDELLPALKDGEIDAIARGEIGNEHQENLDSSLKTIAKKNFNEGFAISMNSNNKALLKKLPCEIRIVTKDSSITYEDWQKNNNIFEQSDNHVLRK